MPPGDTKDPNGKNTFDDVVTALRAVRNKPGNNKQSALDIMSKVGGGATSIRDIKPPLYDAVVAAATQALNPPKATASGAD